MNPYSSFGPLMMKPLAKGHARVPVTNGDNLLMGASNPYFVGGQGRNLLICITRSAESALINVVSGVLAPNCHLQTCVLDYMTPLALLIASTARGIFEAFPDAAPAHIGFIVEDAGLLESANKTGLLPDMFMYTQIKNYMRAREEPSVHVLVASSVGYPNSAASSSSCDELQMQLREQLSKPEFRIVTNCLFSVSPDASGSCIQGGLSYFFDATKFSQNQFMPEEKEILEALQSKLAFVSDVRTMLTSSKLALIMGDVAALDSVYAAIQGKILRGELLSDPTALADVVTLEDRLKGLIDALQQPV